MDAFEYSKYNERTSQMSWVRSIPFISYGYVKRVVSRSHVIVRPVVQRKQTLIDEYNVTLMSLSSAAFELAVMPREGDLVLLFSLNKIHRDMFNSVATRTFDLDGNEKPTETPDGKLVDNAIIFDDNMLGYTGNAMVGILVSTLKGGAALQVSTDTESFTLSSNVPTITQFTKHFTLGFISSDDDTYSINIRIDNKHITNLDIAGEINIKTGFQFDGKEDKPVDTPISITLSEQAPIELLSDSGLSLAFKEAVSLAVKQSVDIIAEEAISIVTKKALELISDGTELVTIGNKLNTLGGILGKYNDILSNFDTVGSPASHVTGPGAKAQLTALKTEQDKVFG